jgi:hypothetical protein
MYTQIEDKLEVRAGCEFIAARAALIEMLQEQQQQLSGQEPSFWIDHVIAGDRELVDTLLGLWGSLEPLKRLKFIYDLLIVLLTGVSIKRHTSCMVRPVKLALPEEWSRIFNCT